MGKILVIHLTVFQKGACVCVIHYIFSGKDTVSGWAIDKPLAFSRKGCVCISESFVCLAQQKYSV